MWPSTRPVTQILNDNHLLVEDVVASLTGVDGGEQPEQPRSIKEQMERAASEVDRRTAKSFARALLDSLCEDPGSLRNLEALLILGLAHPEVLREHRISLAVEGRRLAVLLERAGEVERARCLLELLASRMPDERAIDHELAGILRRSGNTEELIDRYMTRAEECVAAGRVADAIPWLQEVLLLDRTRRDVARMIRDLRYQVAERRARIARRFRSFLALGLIAALVAGVVAREQRIRDEYASLTTADPNEPKSVRVRLDQLGSIIDTNRFWFGMFDAIEEREGLELKIAEFNRERERIAREAEMAEQRKQEMAEAARLRALMHFDRGEYQDALRDFQQALDLASDDWAHRERVMADIKALEAWQGGDR